MKFQVINHLILKIKELFYSYKRIIGLRILIILIKLRNKFNKKDINKNKK